ncbi:MAG: MFS transporter [Acidobacteriaceae bacterium]|nr:MFS transporter [Acidobacteriaceae bacterium]
MLILAAVLAILVYGLIAPMLGALLPTYGLTGDQEGTLAMVQALGLVLASLAAGPVIDKRGNKSALVVGLLLVAGSLFAAPNAGSFAGLLAVYFILGIGGGIVVTGANALVGAVEPTRRGSALNFLNLFFGLGGILTTYAASHLFTPVTLCYSIATLTVIVLAVNIATKMPAGEIGFRLSELPTLLSNPALLLLSFFLFLYVACEVGMWNWLNSYLLSRNFDPGRAGSVVSYGFAFGLLVGRLIISRVLLRVPSVVVIFFAAILIAITTFIMLRLESQAAITIAVFCAGLSMAPVFPTTLAITGDTFQRGVATAMGVVITCGWIGLAVSSPIIGHIKNASSLRNALLVIPGCALIMILVSLALRASVRRPVMAA